MVRFFRIVAIVVAVLFLTLLGLRTWTKSKSPVDHIEYNQDGVSLTITYCQPYKKGRVIFGGILPYGKVWRTGANEATIIEAGQDLQVAGQTLKAGKYTLWTVPGETAWDVIFNAQTGQWGTMYDSTQNVLRVQVPAAATQEMTEQFVMKVQPADGGADLTLKWENTLVTVPFRK
ncbi:MAG: DUF2911 domain-containing protein [Bacteroidia bacterium]|jgi:hypothetical protein|nr:DUF2911 domain-containing protein [Bacteroidia bacterium]